VDARKAALAARIAALSPQKQATFAERLKQRGTGFGRLPIVAAARERAVCSPAQARQWFLWQLDPDNTAYHLSSGMRLRGALSTEALKWSFTSLVQRHEALRTVFQLSAEGVPEQVIRPSGRYDHFELDVSNEPRTVAEMKAAVEAKRLGQTPFDLGSDPPFRVGLIKLAAEEHVLVMVMHHIVSDGWSLRIIADELMEVYRARLEGRDPKLTALPIQYADYALWQWNWLQAGEHARQLAYWQARLGTEHPVLQMPTDHPRLPQARYSAAHHSFPLSAELSAAAHRMARGHRTTVFTVLLAGYQALLFLYTGQSDLRIGMTNANRARPEIKDVVGFFVNTQIARSRIEGRLTLGGLLEQTHAAVMEAQDHHDLPFEQLVEALNPPRSASHPPLFQVMMDHQRHDYAGSMQLPGLTLERYGIGTLAAQFELDLATTQKGDGSIGASFGYAAELFESRTIERLGRHYVQVLATLVNEPNRTIQDIVLPDAPEVRPQPAPVYVRPGHYEPPQGELEEALAAIWSQVLGVKRVGREDNFFELGGHSLLMAKVLARMRERTDLARALRLADLMQSPTIAALAQSLAWGRPSGALIRLNTRLPVPALFCIHQAGGSVFSYFPLAQALNGARTVYGIACRSHIDPEFRDTSALQMASDYARLIREVQPHGPYLLLGHSIGGMLAALIASVLESAGCEVEFLGLVDTFVPAPETDAHDEAATPAGLSAYLHQALPGVQISAGEIADGFAILQHMERIAAQISRLPPLQVRAHCWWMAGRPSTERMSLRDQLGNLPFDHDDIPVAHEGLIKHERLLREVASEIRRE